jgi:putative transposase
LPRLPASIERNFRVGAPDRLWVADATYVPTWIGFLYLAVVVDAWSRRVVGWSMETHLRTALVLQALNMAIWQRRPASVIRHSDPRDAARVQGVVAKLVRPRGQWRSENLARLVSMSADRP